MHWIVNYSGGAASWAAAKLIREHYEQDGDTVTLLFADTLIEHPDTYRFLYEGAEHIGLGVTRIADGRTPFEIFKDKNFLGNSRIDPCSQNLKRRLLDKWIRDAGQEGKIAQVFGLDWTEIDRYERVARRMDHPVIAPLIDHKIDKVSVHQMVAEAGIEQQWLYREGFKHANCGGGCIKAGKKQWDHLYRKLPETYDLWMRQEEAMQEHLGKPVTILRESVDGKHVPVSLRELRRRIQEQPELIPPHDWGGCGCALDE